MSCSNCGNPKVLARGLCQGCYHRKKRTGSVARTYVRNTGHCSVDGCPEPSFAKNLCSRHYQQARHPLAATWAALRVRSRGDYPPEWDVFESFLADVGERPSPKHQLRRSNGDLPWSRDNFRWSEPLANGKDYYTPEQRSEYSREWNLQKKFGISGKQYAEMLAAQGGGCALCGNGISHQSRDGRENRLAVDHDHETGAVRGLLCVRCNRGIGYLNDDPVLLRAAADYLDRHRRPRLVCEGDAA